MPYCYNITFSIKLIIDNRKVTQMTAYRKRALMLPLLFFALFVGGVFGLWGTGARTLASSDSTPVVVVDIAPVEMLVKRVMRGVGAPRRRLVLGADSAHFNALRPSQAAALESADAVFWIGDELSPWLDHAISSLAGDAVSVSLLRVPGTLLLEFRSNPVFDKDGGHHIMEASRTESDDNDDAHDEHGHDDHDDAHDEHGHDDHDDAHEGHGHDDHDDAHEEHGHDDHDDAHEEHGHDEHGDAHEGHAHEGVDPHAWLDSGNARLWLAHIAETLSRLDPANAREYRANAAAGAREIQRAVAIADTRLNPVRSEPFFVYHDSYQYFEREFGLAAIAAVLSSDAVAPGAARLDSVIAQTSAERSHCVFITPSEFGRLLGALETLEPAVVDPLAPRGVTSYDDLVIHVAESMAGCLER